ncbi:MAG TPA: hypothetical protein PKA05_19745, partial [Roseiflexaceae bacterium]|nr:hypothetical protein [Roseiflexaceae bacterium]
MDALTANELEVLRRIPTPAIANAIETFNLQPRTAGYMGPEVRQMFPSLAPAIGYAVTARVVAAHEPGARGPASRADYWHYIEAAGPAPRLAVVEDLDDPPVVGAFFGEVNSNIHKALGCGGA